MKASSPVAIATVSTRIRHTRIRSLIEDINLMLDAGRSSSLLLVCGPTGAGKTTLGNYIVEAELKKHAAEMVADPGLVPAIFVEVLASGEAEFSWRLFYERILIELEGELDIPRTAYGVDPETGRVVRPKGPQTHRLAGLRTAVERSLVKRKTYVIALDEVAHMMQGCSPVKLMNNLNTLKSLSNRCGVQWVLFGSYDLFDLLSLSGQLARRTHVLHFARYRMDNDDDVTAFRACLKKFSEQFGSLKNLDLLPYSEVFHENTLGCIGTLHDVLEILDCKVASRGWSEETLCSALLTEAQVTQIMREIEDGEEHIAPGLKRSLATHIASKQKKAA